MSSKKFCDGCSREITFDLVPNAGEFEIGGDWVDLCPACVPHAGELQRELALEVDQKRKEIDKIERDLIKRFYERLKENAPQEG